MFPAPAGTGTLDVTMARWFLTLTDGGIARKGGVRSAFQDWSAMTDYEMQARLLFATWMVQHRTSFDAIHLLVESKVIELGVTRCSFFASAMIWAGFSASATAARSWRWMACSLDICVCAEVSLTWP